MSSHHGMRVYGGRIDLQPTGFAGSVVVKSQRPVGCSVIALGRHLGRAPYGAGQSCLRSEKGYQHDRT